jgi:hypothetical protein
VDSDVTVFRPPYPEIGRTKDYTRIREVDAGMLQSPFVLGEP